MCVLHHLRLYRKYNLCVQIIILGHRRQSKGVHTSYSISNQTQQFSQYILTIQSNHTNIYLNDSLIKIQTKILSEIMLLLHQLKRNKEAKSEFDGTWNGIKLENTCHSPNRYSLCKFGTTYCGCSTNLIYHLIFSFDQAGHAPPLPCMALMLIK